jgi:hypothetical protein
MKVKIIRVEESEQGIIGVMLMNKEAFCCTLEPDHDDNEPCIPAGSYTCKRVISPKFGETFEITNVPGRTHVLFHAGNVEEHTHGCVLEGQYFGKLKGARAVLNSGATFKQFMAKLQSIDEFDLSIVEVS